MLSFNLIRWLKSRFHARVKTYVNKKRVRLSLEELESRLAPAVYTWTGGAGVGSTNWSTAANWQNGTIPTVGAPVDLVFPSLSAGGSFNSNDNIAGLVVNSMTFSASNYHLTNASNAQSFTLGNSTTNAGTILVNAGALNTIIDDKIVLGTGVSSTEFLTVNSAASLTLNGTLSGNSAVQLTKEGPGLLTLAGNNSGFAGPFNIANTTGNGTVIITDQNALGAATTNAAQSISVTGASSGRTGYKLNITLNGTQYTTGVIGFSANPATDAATIQTALNGFATTAGFAGNPISVIVDANTANSEIFAVNFSGTMAGLNVAQMTVTNTGTTPVPTVTTQAIGGLQNFTTINPNTQLQVNISSGTVFNPMVVSGAGPNGTNGALLMNTPVANSVATLRGTILMNANTTIGVENSNDTLQIFNTISDSNPLGFNLTKEGPGTLFLDPLANIGNTYRGNTLINGGLVEIGQPFALGAGGKTATVNSNSTESATLSLNFTTATGIPAQYLYYAEVQTITLASPTANLTQYSLSYGGVSTLPLLYTGTAADAKTVQNALNALPTILGINASVTVTSPSAGVFDVTFVGGLGGLEIPTLTAIVSSGPGTVTVGTIPGLTPIGFQVPNEFLTLNGPGLEGIHANFTNSNRTFPTPGLTTTTGALSNLSGDNAWEKTITLWTQTSSVAANREVGYYEPAIAIGATGPTSANPLAPFTNLTIDGLIQDNGIGAAGTRYSLTKVGGGRVILTHSNTFSSDIDVINGALNIRDSNALGKGITLKHEIYWGGTLELQTDGIVDSATGTYNLVVPATENLLLSGLGLNNEGALFNMSGVNVINGNISMRSAQPTTSLGVAPDPDPINLQGQTWNDLSQLTVNGVISDLDAATTLTKTGYGEMVLTNQNTYVGPQFGQNAYQTFINQGWITITNSQALGGLYPNSNPVDEPGVLVMPGSALVLKQDASLHNLTVNYNMSLAGTGLALTPTEAALHPWLNGKGALENLDGDNTVTGDIYLNGIAVQFRNTLGNLALPTLTADTTLLTTTGGVNIGIATVQLGGVGTNEVQVIEFAGDITGGTFTLTFTTPAGVAQTTGPITWSSVNATLVANIQAALNGLGAVGPGNSVVGAPNSVGIGVELDGAILPNPNPSQLLFTGTTYDGTTPGTLTKIGTQRLVLQGTSLYTGGVNIQAGVLRAQSDTALGLGTQALGVTTTVNAGTSLEFAPTNPQLAGGSQRGLEVWYNNLILNGTGNPAFDDAALVVEGGDNMWRGPITLNTVNPTIDVFPNTRFGVSGVISDGANPSGISLQGGGEMALYGTNTYRGITTISPSTLTIGSDHALGAPAIATQQTLTLTGAIANSTMISLSFNGAGAGYTTAARRYTGNAIADAANLQADLNALGSIGGVGGQATVTANAGDTVFTITLGGSLIGFAQPTLGASVTVAGSGVVNVVTAGTGGTIVQPGAQLQLSGGVNINGKPLLIQGNGVSAESELQQLTVSGPSGGTFQLSFKNPVTNLLSTTASLTIGATAAQVLAALNGLSSLVQGGAGTGGGSVAVNETGDGIYTILFKGTFAGAQQPRISPSPAAGVTAIVSEVIKGGTANATPQSWFNSGPAPISGGQVSLTPGANSAALAGPVTSIATDPKDPNIIYIATAGGGAWKTTNGGLNWTPLFDGVSDVQSLTITGTNPATDTFSLTFTNPFTGLTATTAPLAFNATPEQIESAINGITGAGNTVHVSQNINLNGVNEAQQISFLNFVPGSTKYALTFNGASTPIFPNGTIYTGIGGSGINSDAATIQGILNALPTIGGLAVPGFVTVVPDPGTPNAFDVTFGGSLANSPQPLITLSPSAGGAPGNQTGFSQVPSPGMAVAELTRGAAGTFSDTISFAGGNLANVPIAPLSVATNGAATVAVATVENGVGTSAAMFGGAVAVNSAFPNIVYFGSGNPNNSATSYYGTGVYKSTDYGQTWNLLTAPSAAPDTNPIFGLAVSSISPDPLNPNIVYVATSDMVTGAVPGVGIKNAPTAHNAGVWRYDAASQTWFNLTNVVSTMRATTASQTAHTGPLGPDPLFVDPPNAPGPDNNYLIDFQQTNADWTTVQLSTNPNNTAPWLPGTTETLYAALGNSTGWRNGPSYAAGVYYLVNPATVSLTTPPIWYNGEPGNSGAVFPSPPLSSTLGTTFTDFAANTDFPTNELQNFYRLGAPLGVLDPLSENIRMAFVQGGGTSNVFSYSTQSNDRLYATSVNINTGGINFVTTSPNSGQDWNPIPSPPNYLGSSGNTASALAAAPGGILYVGGTDTTGTGTYVEEWNGTSWLNISKDALGNGPHMSVLSMVITPNTNNLLVGTEGGIWEYNPGTSTWSDLNSNLSNVTFNDLVSDPTNPNIVIGTTVGTGTIAYNGNQNWTQIDGSAGSAGFNAGKVQIDPNNPQVIYHVQINSGQLLMSSNGGATWAPAAGFNSTAANYPMVVDNNSRVFAGGTSLQLYNPTIGNWVNLTAPVGSVDAIGVPDLQGSFQADPSFPLVTDIGAGNPDPNTVYIAMGGNIFVTKDLGVDWFKRTPVLASPATFDALEVDPTNRDHVYAITKGQLGGLGVGTVWETTNAGVTWNNITANLPVGIPAWAVTIDPRTGNLYLGNDNGVYELPSGTTTWQIFGFNLPNVSVHALDLNQSTNILTAGTFGRGAYQFYLDSPTIHTGALRAEAGSAVWNGPIILGGSATISANGNQNLQNNVAVAQLQILGTISDQTFAETQTNANTLTKVGLGNIVLVGSDVYGGQTVVQQGNLVIHNSQSLSGIQTTVETGAVLQLATSLNNEPLLLFGNGTEVNGHFSGALENVSNNNVYTGTITLGTNSTIGVDGTSTLTIASSNPIGITDPGGPNGKFGLSKEGSGTLVLASADNYEGNTTVNQGALNVQHSLALGASGTTTTVLDGAQLQLQAPGSGPLAVTTENLVLSGSGISKANTPVTGALLNVSGNNTWGGPTSTITLAPVPSFAPVSTPSGIVSIGVANPGETLTIGGTITEPPVPPQSQSTTAPPVLTVASGLAKVGAGTLTLTQNDTYSGSTYVNAGVLGIQAGGALGLNNGNAVQRITVVDPLGSDQFTLSFNGSAPSAPLPFGATVAQVAAALNGLPTIGANGVTVTSYRAYPGVSEQQQLTFIGAQANTTSFQLSFNGSPSAPIPYTGVAGGPSGDIANITNALNGLVTIGGLATPGSVTVTADSTDTIFTVTFGGSLSDQQQPLIAAAVTGAPGSIAVSELARGDGFPTDVYTIAFVKPALSGAQPLIIAAPSPVTSGLTVAVSTVADGGVGTQVAFGATLQLDGDPTHIGASISTPAAESVVLLGNGQTLAVNGAVTGGNFTITFGGQTTTSISATLTGNAMANAIQTALNGLGNVGPNNASVVANANNTYSIGFSNTVTPSPISVTASAITGGEVFFEGSLNNLSGNNTWAGSVYLQSSMPPATLINNDSITTQPGTQLTVTGLVQDPVPNPAPTTLPASLTKDGMGTLVFPNANTYTGSNFINGGILNIQNSNSLGVNTSSQQQMVISGTFGNFTLALSGFGNTTAALPFNATAAAMQSALNTMLATPGSYGYLSAAAFGTATVTPTSAGSTYVVVFGGTLVSTPVPTIVGTQSGVSNVAVNVSLPTNFNGGFFTGGQSTNVVLPGATLQLQSAATPVNEASLKPTTISGSGFGNNGALENVSGNNTFGTANPVTLQPTLAPGGGVAGSWIGTDASSTLTVNQALAGANANVDKVGTGTLIFTAANTYTGTTTVLEGLLQLNSGGSPAIAGPLQVGQVLPTTTIQTLTVPNTVTTFTLTYKSGPTNFTSAVIPFTGTAADAGAIQNALNAIVGAYNYVTVNQTGTGTFDVAFEGALAGTSIPLLTPSTGSIGVALATGLLPYPNDAEVQLLASNQITPSGSVAVAADGWFDLNNNNQTVNTLNISGGLATTGTGALTVGTSITIVDGTLNTNGAGGVVNDNGVLKMTAGTVALTGNGSQFNLGGSLVASDDSAGTPATVSGVGGTFSVGSTGHTFNVTDVNNQTNHTDLLFTGNLAGSSGIDKIGAGQLQVTSLNPGYTGAITIDAGNVQVDGAIAAVILQGGTLSGVGTVGTVSGSPAPNTPAPAGTINPGDNAVGDFTGTLTTGNEDLGGATLFIDLDPNNLNADVLDVTGNAIFANTILTGAIGAGASTIPINQQFTIVSATGSVSGPGSLLRVINGVPSPIVQDGSVFISGQKFTVHYNAKTIVLTRALEIATVVITSAPGAGTSVYGQDVHFTATVTPEPGATLPAGDTVVFTLDKGTPSLVTTSPAIALDSSNQAVWDPQTQSPVPFTWALGTHTIDATFNDPTNFFGPSNALTFTQTVNQGSTSIGMSSSPAVSSTSPTYGQFVTITATVSAVVPPFTAGSKQPTGTVTFFVDSNPALTQTVGLNASDQATIVLPILNAGAHVVQVNYSGDNNYLSSVTSPNFSVPIKQDTETITASASPSSSSLGQMVTLTATITPNLGGSQGLPTGTVSFYDGNVAVANFLGSASIAPNGTTATLATNILSVASHSITITYAGDPNYVGPTVIGTPLPFVVTKAATTTSFINPPTTSVFGQPITFSVTVTPAVSGSGLPTPVGTVSFYENSVAPGNLLANKALNASDTVSFSLSTLPAASYTIIATYSGDPNFLGYPTEVFASTNLVVGSAATATTLNGSPSTGTFGQGIVFTATVTSTTAPAPTTGIVTFVDSSTGAPLGAGTIGAGGKASLFTSALTAGTHTISATYTDTTNNYSSSIGQITSFVDNKANTVTTVAATPGSGDILGQTVTLTATVTSSLGTPTSGTVTFVDTTTGITLGSASIAVASPEVQTLTVGSGGTFELSFNGSAPTVAFNPATVQGSVIQTALNNLSTIVGSGGTVVVSPSGNASSYTITFGGAFTGTVQPAIAVQNFGGDTASLAITSASAKATITTSSMPAGPQTITASYVDSASEANYANSSGLLVNYTVARANTTTVVTAAAGDVFGQLLTITATVTSPTVAPPAFGTVTFTESPSGLNLGTATVNANGVATITTSVLNAGTHTFTANYADAAPDNSYNVSNGSLSGYVIAAVGTSTSVIASPPSGDIFGQPVTFTAAVSSAAGAPTAGTVTFVDSTTGTTLGTGVINNSGQASITTTVLTSVSHTITATYTDTIANGNFLGSSGVLNNYIVSGASTTTTLAVSPVSGSVFGQTVTLTATVGSTAGTPTIGTVTFLDATTGTTLGSGTVNANGKVTITTNVLTATTHQLTATYNDIATNTNFATSTSSATTYTVTPVATNTVVSATPLIGDSYGQSVTFTATISSNAGSPAFGSVTFVEVASGTTLGTGTVTAGKATIVTTALTTGQHSISASYTDTLPDTNFSASSGQLNNYGVSLANTTTAVTASAGPDLYGQTVTFTAAVTWASGTPSTGTVTFVDNFNNSTLGVGTVNASGIATITTNVLAATTHSIKATYVDVTPSNFNSSVGQLNGFVVGAAVSSVGVTATPSGAAFGSPVTFTATVTSGTGGSPSTGSVSFVDSTTGASLGVVNVNSNGLASVVTSSLAAGSHTITANYTDALPNTNFTNGSGSLTYSVSAIATSTGVTAFPAGGDVYGQTVTFTASVTSGAGVPTVGSVMFVDGTTGITLGSANVNNNGKASIVTSVLTATTHTIAATYTDTAPNTNFATSTGSLAGYLVSPITTATSVAVSPVVGDIYGQTVTFTASVSSQNGAPTVGTVSFVDNTTGATLGTAAVDTFGKATITTSVLTATSHAIVANYSDSADTNFLPSSGQLNNYIVGSASTTTTVTASPASSNASVGSNVTFTATIGWSGGAATAGSVTFLDSGNVLGTGTVSASGVATIVTNTLTAGTHTITANYTDTAPDTNFSSSSGQLSNYVVNNAATTTAVTASPTSGDMFGQSIALTATISSGIGTPTVGQVTFVDTTTNTLLGIQNVNASGQAIISTSALSATTHVITATYADTLPDTNFAGSSGTLNNYVVASAGTNTSVTATPGGSSTLGQTVTFTATVTSSAAGSVNVGTVSFVDTSTGTSLGTGTVNANGQATVQTNALLAGTHTITASYADVAPNTNFASSSNSIGYLVTAVATSTTVNANLSSGDVYGQAVSLTATIGSSAGSPTVGNVTFVDSTTGATLGSANVNASGQATLLTTALTATSHTLTATYNDNIDNNFASSSGVLTNYVVSPVTTTTTLSPAPGSGAAFGQSVTLTATVNSNAGSPSIGIVTFTDTNGSTLGTKPVNASGQATLVTNALSASSHNLTATYTDSLPDTNFASSSGHVNGYVVSSASTSVGVSATPPSGDTFGQAVTLTAAVTWSGGTPSTGSVTFVDSTTNVTLGTQNVNVSGIASIVTTALTAATHTITATYTDTLPDTNFATGSGQITGYVVGQEGTSVGLVSSAPSIGFGQAVTFTATVSATTPGSLNVTSGTVTFKDGATTLGTIPLSGSNVASFSTTALSQGVHSITATYVSGTTNIAGSSATISQTVLKPTTISVNATPSPSVFGQTVNLAINLSSGAGGTPSGTVTVSEGGNTLGSSVLNSGNATIPVNGLNLGANALLISYSGDGNYGSNTKTINQTVNVAPTSTVVSPTSAAVFGQSITFTATVSITGGGAGSLAGGTVTFKDGAATLGTGTINSSNQATSSTTSLSVAGHSITATYVASTDFATSTSAPVTQTVTAASTSTTLASSSPAGSSFGQSVSFTATVSGTSPSVAQVTTGSVTFKDGTTTLGTITLSGSNQAVFTTSALSVATHNIIAFYTANTSYGGSTSNTVTQVVSTASTTTALKSSLPGGSNFGQNVTFTATVTGTGGGIPTSGTVTFKDGATTLGTITLSGSNVAQFSTAGLAVGSGHSITAMFSGTTNYTSSTSAPLTQVVNQAPTSVAITTSPTTWIVNQPVTFTASVTAATGGTPTGTVSFMIDGVVQSGTPTLSGGKATFVFAGFTTTGNHTVTVNYGGTGNFASSSGSLTQNVVNSETVTVSSSNPNSTSGTTVTFTATISGPAGPATGTVRFYDGTTLLGTGTVNSSSLATFSISSLSIGTHSITAVYSGDGHYASKTSAAISQVVKSQGRLT